MNTKLTPSRNQRAFLVEFTTAQTVEHVFIPLPQITCLEIIVSGQDLVIPKPFVYLTLADQAKLQQRQYLHQAVIPLPKLRIPLEKVSVTEIPIPASLRWRSTLARWAYCFIRIHNATAVTTKIRDYHVFR